MSERINLLHNPINQACVQMNAAANGLQSSFAARIEGDSQLDTVNRLNELNADLSEVLNTYHAMLLQHIEVTRKTVETLENTDIRLANQFALPYSK